MLPFFKPKKGFMLAGGGLEISSGGGGGGSVENDFYHNNAYSLAEGQDFTDLISHTVENAGYYLVSCSFITSNDNIKTRILSGDNVVTSFLSNARHYDTVVLYLNTNDTVKVQIGMNTYDSTTIDLSAGILKIG